MAQRNKTKPREFSGAPAALRAFGYSSPDGICWKREDGATVYYYRHGAASDWVFYATGQNFKSNEGVGYRSLAGHLAKVHGGAR